MILSISKKLGEIKIPKHKGEIKMIAFDLETLKGVPTKFKSTVKKMLKDLPYKKGTAFLTVDGKRVKKGKTQRRGGPHIDGNYIAQVEGSIKGYDVWGKKIRSYPRNTGSGGDDWGPSGDGPTGWKVGDDGQTLTPKVHRASYDVHKGGMLIASTYPACKGWNGKFRGKAKTGGDCSHLKLEEGFILEPNTVYYGSSQFVHESLPLDKEVHRTLIRITLPADYPYLN